MSEAILVDMAHDTFAVLMDNPGVTVTAATVESVPGGLLEAVVIFSDNGRLIGTFELPADLPPAPKLIAALGSLLLDACRNIEAGIARDLPRHGHSLH